MSKSNPTIHSARAWKFNTGDLARGNGGLIDIPAGPSAILTAEEAAHPYAQFHAGKTPVEGLPGDAGVSADDYAVMQARLKAVTDDRDEQAAKNKALTEQVEAMTAALSQTPDEVRASLESQLRALDAELAGVRSQLAQAQARGNRK